MRGNNNTNIVLYYPLSILLLIIIIHSLIHSVVSHQIVAIEMIWLKKKKHNKKYEERSYPAQTWVKTQMRHSSREQCTNSMFLKLLDYISGQENDKQVNNQYLAANYCTVWNLIIKLNKFLLDLLIPNQFPSRWL